MGSSVRPHVAFVVWRQTNNKHGLLIFAYAKGTQQWVFWLFLAVSYCSKSSSEQKRAIEVRVWLSACATWAFFHNRQEHERMGECLIAERDRFMAVLEKERRERAHLEAFACSIIQAAYRGCVLRQRHVARNCCARVRRFRSRGCRHYSLELDR